MPTVLCDHTDCLYHGMEVCTAQRVTWLKGEMLCYKCDVNGAELMDAPFRPRCHKQAGKYVSDKQIVIK